MNDSAPHFESEALLDNPIWNSLATRHAHLAIGAHTGHGLARRNPANIGPLSAVQEPTSAAYADLAAIVPEDDVAVLFLKIYSRFLRAGSFFAVERLFRWSAPVPDQPALAEAILPMKPTDFPELVALASLTEPGPFRDHTANLGGFVRVHVDGRLAAMAGQRLAPSESKPEL
jgi:hypothetical protein